MDQVFISYASADRDRAKRLAAVMEAKGYKVWWDREIAAGQTFDEVIEKALDDSKCVVVLWSATSVRSDWVKTEAAEAAKRKVLVPALIDEVKIPLEFRRIQAADLTHWNGHPDDPEFQKFLSAIDIELTSSTNPKIAPSAARSVGSTSGAAAVMAPDPNSIQNPAPAAKPAVERRRTESLSASREARTSPPPKAHLPVGKLAVGLLAVAAVVFGSMVWFNRAVGIQTPSLTGMTYEQAASTLTAAGLTPQREDKASGADPAGTVLAQVPIAGTTLAKDATVILTVAVPAAAPPAVPTGDTAASSAFQPQPPPVVDPPASVPDLKGQTTNRAAELLTAAGLKVGTTSEVASNDVTLGTVVGQDPAAAQSLTKGAVVNITVVTRRKVPELIGLESVKAQEELTRLGLTNRLQRERAANRAADGRVTKQSPAPGTEIENGGQAELTVGIVTPKKVSGAEGLYKTNGQRCIETCKNLGLKWTGEWSGGTNNSCTCDF
jgi:beta-lactam-binding protein with PASTA domain